ncbi:hypothetical protein OOT33_06150 [Sphingobium sp. DEHP117]|uniref:hypothetical protein n=1 Tax=Sphingobium sp. DEHP117 TaxID=2993436 RepID=UPI0027D4C284|nr:hypothetical protein [Sphingobium sp. DEHP117]MDQ4420021.1 hypothetical protein [Sphingobium sp. DEHP117]
MAGVGFGLSRAARRKRGSGSGGGGGFASYSLPNAVDVRYEPSILAPSVDGSNRVTVLPDINGLANATAITAGAIPGGGAPKLVTDAQGRKALLFEGNNALEIADTLASYTANGCTAYAVLRYFDANSTNAQSVFAVGRNANASAPNTLRAFMNTLAGSANGIAANAHPPFPAHGGKYLCDNAGVYGTERVAGQSRRKMICHSGLQVVAIAGGAANTAQIHMNDEYCTGVTTINTGTTVTSGGEIGRHAFAPGGTNYGSFLLYALFIKRSAQTTPQIQANIAAMMSAYGISSLTNSFILEGDSRFANAGAVAAGESPYGYLQVELASRLPSSWRVLRSAIGGSQIDADIGATGSNIDKGLRNKRDFLNRSLFSGNWELPGRNLVAIECWHNDDGQTTSPIYVQPTLTAARADEIYANLQNLVLNDARGFLKLGYEYLASLPMPGSGTKDPSLNQIRARYRSANFFHDFLGAAGDTYAGKVRRAEVPLCMPISGAWGSQVLGPGLSTTDARIQSQGGIYFNDQAHPISACYPYIAQCLADRVLGADPYL